MVKLFALGSLLLTAPALASTGFHLGNGLTKDLPNIYAISTGWYYPVKGAVTINARNVHKTAENFGENLPEFGWTSTYGSVTKTMHGLEFPMSGMNEKGLVIQATVLLKPSQPDIPAGGTGLHSLQWIQYLLDTSATLEEVIHKTVTLDAPIIPHGTSPVQYQVCDAHDCAVLAFYDQKAVAQGSLGLVEADFAQNTLTVSHTPWLLSAIANRTYAENMVAYSQCRSFPCTTPDESTNRFIKAARALHSFVGKENLSLNALEDEVFARLQEVDQNLPLTTWNETYAYLPHGNDAEILLSFKSPKRPLADRQWLDFSHEDFDCRRPRKIWWQELERAGGDQSGASAEFKTADQELLIRQHAARTTPEQMAKYIAYPAAKTKCLTSW